MLSKNKIGLTIGSFFAIIHFLWALFVLSGYAGLFLDWMLSLHFIGLNIPILNFNFIGMIYLVLYTFLFGYIFGWIFAACWNTFHKR